MLIAHSSYHLLAANTLACFLSFGNELIGGLTRITSSPGRFRNKIHPQLCDRTEKMGFVHWIQWILDCRSATAAQCDRMREMAQNGTMIDELGNFSQN